MEAGEKFSKADKLIARLKDKRERLSFSSLRAFGGNMGQGKGSPANFMRYKLEPRKPPSEGQVLGSLCDHLLSTKGMNHDEYAGAFEGKYEVVDFVPTTINQIGFCEDVLDGVEFGEAFKKNYKSGSLSKLEAQFRPYLEAKLEGKEVVLRELMDKAIEIVKNIATTGDEIKILFERLEDFQHPLDWEYEGWGIKGYADAVGYDSGDGGNGLVVDFKYTKNANPRKFERDIYEYDYFMQLGMYAEAFAYENLLEEDSLDPPPLSVWNADLSYAERYGYPECYIIAYDKNLNYQDFKINADYIHYGIEKYRYLVEELTKCTEEGRYNESYGYFDKVQRVVLRPKWVEGF